jgi:Domain of unknown function (DUF4258)
MTEPLSPTDAKRLLLSIIEDGQVVFTRHAQEEMAKDNLNDGDVLNILRGGVVEPAEQENGSWRYRVRTSPMYAVVAFRGEDEAVVVTAWRKG